MEKFRLNGTTVEIIRFVVKYKEEDTEQEIYISTKDELSLVTERLDNGNITYEVEDVDISDCWFLDGATYTGYDEVFAAIEAGEKVFAKSIRSKNLAENSERCKYTIEHGFNSEAKGDGLQPYRMTLTDDQPNLNGMLSIINTLILTGTKPEDIRLFSWQNANQIECVNDWHYTQIIKLTSEFADWKERVLKRQDEIKKEILEAQTAEEINAVMIDYGDLLNFGGE